MYQFVFILKIKVHLRRCINMYYQQGHSIFSQNRSTCLDTHYELGYFELITSETCQHECEKPINCVKTNKLILAQTRSYLVLSCEKCIVFLWFAPTMSIIINPS